MDNIRESIAINDAIEESVNRIPSDKLIDEECMDLVRESRKFRQQLASCITKEEKADLLGNVEVYKEAAAVSYKGMENYFKKREYDARDKEIKVKQMNALNETIRTHQNNPSSFGNALIVQGVMQLMGVDIDALQQLPQVQQSQPQLIGQAEGNIDETPIKEEQEVKVGITINE